MTARHGFWRRAASRVLPRLCRAGRAEDGAVTVDFVVVFPLFMMVLLASIESAILMTRFVMLERALDMTVRELRLGQIEDPNHDKIKDRLCAHSTMIPNCATALMLELRPVNRTSWNVFQDSARCANRDAPINQVTHPHLLPDVDAGASNEMMLVRACAVYDPFFPTTAWGLQLTLDDSGGYQVVALSGFVNEPR